MARKLNLVIVLLIPVLIISLPLNADARRGGRSGGLGLPFGWIIVKLGSARTGGLPDFTPVLESHGVLSLKVTTQDAEMYVDGRFIGLARDFKGPAVVSIPAGDHVIELKYNGLSYKTNAHIPRGHTTTLVYTFNKNES